MRTTETDKVVNQIPAVYPTLHVLFSAGLVVGKSFSLRQGSMDIGREVNDDTGIALQADGRASRLHARVELRSIAGGAAGPQLIARVVDAQSKNGTFINGVQITESGLHEGDVLRIGNSLLLLRFEPARRIETEIEPLFGRSPAMRLLRTRVVEAAPSLTPVLIMGETGAGKDVTACALHALSKRSGPMKALNCAAIPPQLAESELFGHAAGSFSGANKAHKGYFEAAHNGTLFLDEVGDLPAALQPKLLRALEAREITPVGSTHPTATDVRVIAATNRDLRAEVRSGIFRADLYARLSGHEIVVPPLRMRREDILPLLMRALNRAMDGRALRMTARLAEALVLYRWPFNVRELLQLAAVLAPAVQSDEELDLPLVAERLQEVSAPPEPGTTAPDEGAPPSLCSAPPSQANADELRLSPAVLERLAAEANWNISEIARVAGRSRRQVRRWLEQHGLIPSQEPRSKGSA